MISPKLSVNQDSGCNSCTHPTCPHGQNSHGVSACVECESGVLTLDQASQPKWKLGCNRCDVIVRLFEDAAKVTVLNEQSCTECDAQTLRVEYKEGKSKLSGEEGKRKRELRACTSTAGNSCLFFS